MIAELMGRMRGFPDVRKGKNLVYGVEEVGMVVISVFFMRKTKFKEAVLAMFPKNGHPAVCHPPDPQ